jgi:hypothetical protein
MQSPPVLPGGGGGGGGSIAAEPVVLFDSGLVVPTLAHWVYVKSTKAGVLFPKGTFDKSVRITVFLKQLSDFGAALVSLHYTCACRYTHTHTHIYIYIYIYVQACLHSCFLYARVCSHQAYSMRTWSS